MVLSIYLWEISRLLLLMHVYTFSSALLFADKPRGGGGGRERERESNGCCSFLLFRGLK
jgi:hypothetical protein